MIGGLGGGVNFEVSSEPFEVTSAFQFVPDLLLRLFKLSLQQAVVVG